MIMKEIIEKLQREFYTLSQEIIEKHYLTPYSKNARALTLSQKDKENLKDGILERQLHSGMHAGRAQFWALIWHNKFNEMFPKYIDGVFAEWTAKYDLDKTHFLALLRYAVLFHDSAQENDVYSSGNASKNSAKNCYDFFVTVGIPSDLAELLSQAIFFRNDPVKYNEYLKNSDLTQQLISCFEYFRKLIYIADHQDKMRNERLYKVSDIIATFIEIDEFDVNIHLPQVVETTRHIHSSIKAQKDMLVPCEVSQPDGNGLNLRSEESCYNLAHRTAIEHADNVCSVLGAMISSDPFFQKDLVNEVFLDTNPSLQNPPFNPYIHGTNSASLPLLTRTNLSMISPYEMLETYGLAPMSGELDSYEGYVRNETDIVNPPKHVCFGRMLAKGGDVYNLDKVSSVYASRLSTINEENTINRIHELTERVVSCGFENINKLLIHSARAKQLGIEPFSEAEYTRLDEKFNSVIQYYYFLMILGKHVHPNVEQYQKAKQLLADAIIPSDDMYSRYMDMMKKRKEIGDDEEYSYERYLNLKKEASNYLPNVIYTHLSYQTLLDKITAAKINMKEIYEHPTNDNIARVLSMLEFPKTSTIEIGSKSEKQEVTLSDTQFFTSTKNYSIESQVQWSDKSLYLCCKNDQNYTIERLISNMFEGIAYDDTCNRFEKILLDRIDTLMSKWNILKKITTAVLDEVKFSKEEKDLIEKPFPIIMMCPGEEKIMLNTLATQEYRSYQPLKLGDDITVLATDTKEHQSRIVNFLAENNINNVQVVLIDQLATSKNTDKTAPQSTYTHADALPGTSLFAAQAVPNTAAQKGPLTTAPEHKETGLFEYEHLANIPRVENPGSSPRVI